MFSPRADLVAFCDRLTASMDKGKATVTIYQDLCKAFDMVPFHISSLNWTNMDLKVDYSVDKELVGWSQS